MFFGKKQTENRDTKPNSKKPWQITEKIEHFFSTEPQKEKVLRHEDFYRAGDGYYAQVSAVYKVAQRFIWLFFVFFLVITIIANYRSITYDNFFFLIKDLSSAADSTGSNYETLSYEADSRQRFTLYRGGIASVSPSQISVFTATGRRTLRASSSFLSPFVISSKQYILVYDTSAKQIALYNSFARIHTESFDYPIYDACMGEDGSFAVATKTAERSSAVYVYDDSFSFDGGIESDHYVFDLAMRRDRNTLAILMYEMGTGTGRTILSARNLNTKKEVQQLSFDGEFPLGCVFLDKDLFAVVTDHQIRIYDQSFRLVQSSDSYGSGKITAYSLTEEGIALAFSDSSKNFVLAFDKTGKLLYNSPIQTNISDLCVYDDVLFLQTESGVYRINSSNEQAFLPSGQGKMLIYNDTTALVCGSSKAEYLVFKK